MKTFIFHRESNKFDDILSNATLKPLIRQKISFYRHMIVRIDDNPSVETYVNIMFGEDMLNELVPDRSPKPGIDYMPEKKRRK